MSCHWLEHEIVMAGLLRGHSKEPVITVVFHFHDIVPLSTSLRAKMIS